MCEMPGFVVNSCSRSPSQFGRNGVMLLWTVIFYPRSKSFCLNALLFIKRPNMGNVDLGEVLITLWCRHGKFCEDYNHTLNL